jgi:SAM-dependent methyltransferase
MVSEHELDRFHDVELDGWRRLAAGYARYFEPLVRQAIEPLLDEARVARDMHVLDLCCGSGYLATEAARRGAIAVGVDFAAEMIALAKARWPGVEFREGDAEALQLPDRSFDAVVMSFGMHHLARPEAAMSHIARVLKPGGRIVFTVWAEPADSVGHRILLQALNAHGRLEVGLPAGPSLFRFSDEGETIRLFGNAGLVDAAIRKFPLAWELPGPDGLFDAFVAGGVRIAILLAEQSPNALERIRQSVREACAPHQHGHALRIPMTAVLASARRP